jgi:SAM-dependent methyltransferase
MKNLNLACGQVYVVNEDWINLDYVSIDSNVKSVNLLEGLPFDTNAISVVYSSHFLEHIPLHQVPLFLKECHRILKPGGIIRLVLPDFEEMCREYLSQLDRGDYIKARLCVIEIIDQCVRLEGGGELGKAYLQYSKDEAGYDKIRDYIYSRNGQQLPLPNITNQPSKMNKVLELLIKPESLIKKLIYLVKQLWITIIISFLPKAFRQQNISMAPIGERHHWLWDFFQLENALQEIGFVHIERSRFDTSRISDFPLHYLDVNPDNLPRKGKHSMYVEAQKNI